MNRFIIAAAALAVAATARPARADGPDPLYSCKKARDGDKVTLAFKPETRLDELITWYMGMSCATIVFSADVACRTSGATLLTPEPMTVKQARALFFDALDVMGLRAKVKGNKIVITERPGKAAVDKPECATASAEPTTLTPTPSTPSTSTATSPTSDPPPLDVSGVKKLDATHVELPRAVLDAMLADPMTAAKSARVVPAMKDGKPRGFKLYAIRPSSVWSALGLNNGDTITAVAGKQLTTVEVALDVYTSLQHATAVKVDLIRRGKPMTIEYTLK